MRITIEPTCEPSGSEDTVNHKVVIEHPYDDLTSHHVKHLVKRALVAFGYLDSSQPDEGHAA